LLSGFRSISHMPPNTSPPLVNSCRLAAILAADVVGYSRLMGEDEAGTARAVREHREAARPVATSVDAILNVRFTSTPAVRFAQIADIRTGQFDTLRTLPLMQRTRLKNLAGFER
jgi:hypothetical protein